MDDHAAIDQLRYRRILRFFAGVIANIVWWDLVVGRVPVARQPAASPAGHDPRVSRPGP